MEKAAEKRSFGFWNGYFVFVLIIVLGIATLCIGLQVESKLSELNSNLAELKKLKEKEAAEKIIQQLYTDSQIDEAYEQALEAPEECSYSVADEHFTWSVEHTKRPSDKDIDIDDINGMEVEVLSKNYINKRKLSLHLKPLSAIERDEVEVTDIFLDISYIDEGAGQTQCFNDFSSVAKGNKIILVMYNDNIETVAHAKFILKK